MRNFLFVVVVMLMAAPVMADSTAEIQLINSDPTLDLSIAGVVHKGLGWSAFALVDKEWGQAYAGPTFAPTTWSTVSASIGVETAGGRRLAQSLWLGKGRCSMLAIHEDGPSGNWHKIVAEVLVTKQLAVGYHEESPVGRGVRAKYTRGKVAVWGALLMKDDHVHTILALTVNN